MEKGGEDTFSNCQSSRAMEVIGRQKKQTQAGRGAEKCQGCCVWKIESQRGKTERVWTRPKEG